MGREGPHHGKRKDPKKKTGAINLQGREVDRETEEKSLKETRGPEGVRRACIGLVPSSAYLGEPVPAAVTMAGLCLTGERSCIWDSST